MPAANLSILVQAHVDRGIADLKRKDYASAIARFDSAIKVDPKSARVHVLRGRALARLDRFDEALQAIDTAIQLSPDDSNSLTERGTIFVALGHHDKALADFDSAIKAGATRATNYFHRGAVFFNLKQWSRAAEDFTKVLSQEKSPQAWFYRGLCRRQLNDAKSALADFTAALVANPAFADALRERASLHSAVGNFEEAIKDATRWMELSPNNSEALALRGETQQRLGRDAEALADYQASLSLTPDDPKAVNRVAWLLTTSDTVRDVKQALELAERANELANKTDPLILDTVAVARAANGDSAGAQKAIDQAISISPPELQAELIRRRESL